MDLQTYQAKAQENVRYDLSEKSYIATDRFRPIFVSANSNPYLSELLSVGMGLRNKNESFIGWSPEIGVLPFSNRWIDPDILSRTLKAIKRSQDLQINYQSMSSDERSTRWISPHALGFDGFRWHIRAYCHNRKAFRDFVFARIASIASERESTTDPMSDKAWQNNVIVKIGPHPKLSDSKRKMVEIDYEMTNGIASIEIRSALLFYLLKRLGLLDTLGEQLPPQKQHVVLLNQDELIPALRENEIKYERASS